MEREEIYAVHEEGYQEYVYTTGGDVPEGEPVGFSEKGQFHPYSNILFSSEPHEY